MIRKIMGEKKENKFKYKSIIIKIVLWLIPVVISLFALWVSYNANSEAKESNKIAREALEKSEENFIIKERPYLSVRPKKYKDSDVFILAEKKDDALYLEMKYELANNGNLPAINIRLPGRIAITSKEKIPNVFFDIPEGLSLAKGDSVDISMKIGMGFEEQNSVEDNLILYEEGKLEFPMTVILYYESNLANSPVYKTKISVTVKKTEVIIHESDME